MPVSVESIAMTMNLDEKPPFDDDMAKSGKDIWESYAAGENLFTNNGEGASRRIRALSKKLFSPEEKMKVDFLDIQSKFEHQRSWPKQLILTGSFRPHKYPWDPNSSENSQ
jgi:hypothetical protein